MIFLLVGIFSPVGEINPSTFEAPIVSGLLEGYQTYDALAGLLTGGVVVISINNNQSTSGKLSNHMATATFNYIRKIPWGVINAGYSTNQTLQENNAKTLLNIIIGEQIKLSTISGIAFLTNTEIDIESIRVFNLNRTIEYIEGIDYVLTMVDGNAGIELGLFGEIEDNQQLLVDYQYQSNTSNEIAQSGYRQEMSLRLWEKLYIYYNYSTNQAELLSGISNASFDTNFTRSFGGQLDLNWSKTTIKFQERVNRVHSKHVSFSQVIRHKFNNRLSAGLAIDYSEIELVDSNELIEARGFSGHLTWMIDSISRLELNFSSGEKKSILRDSKNSRATVILQTRFGEWNLRASYIYKDNIDSFENNLQLQSRNNLLISIKRRFK